MPLARASGINSGACWRLIGEPCIAAIYRPGHQYKKAGVLFLELCPAGVVQGGLFDMPDSPRSRARMRAIDHLNRRFGRDTVSFAVAGVTRGWKLRSDFISPRFTTNWEDLLAVGPDDPVPAFCCRDG